MKYEKVTMSGVLWKEHNGTQAYVVVLWDEASRPALTDLGREMGGLVDSSAKIPAHPLLTAVLRISFIMQRPIWSITVRCFCSMQLSKLLPNWYS